MAFTVSNLFNTVWGNKNIRTLRVTTDSAENTIATGFQVIEAIIGTANELCSDAVYCLKINKGTTGTAANGFIGASGLASGDILFITVAGR